MDAPGAPVLAGDVGASLRRKLSWLTFFRLVTMTVLLGGTAFVTWRGASELLVGAAPLYALVAVVFGASLVFALLLRSGRWMRASAYAQIALDVGVATAVVGMTGYADSVFVFLFSLAIVDGSILLFRRGALVALALTVAAYGVLIPLAGAAGRPTVLMVFAHCSAFAATAALGGYLSEQLRRTGERLEAREGDLAAITALHEAIVRSVASGIVTTDAEGRVTLLNPAAEQIVGVPAAQVLGRRSPPWLETFQASTGRDEGVLVNAAGKRLRIGYTLFPLVDAVRRRLGTAVIFQDLTHLREMEEAVKRGERLADLGRLAAGLAHEMRNPLASMMGSVELIRGSAGLAPQEDRLMEIVLREAGRLDQLVARFLEFARPAPPRREQIDLSEILRETVQVFANHPAGARVSLIQELDPAPASCDPDQVRQIAWNLLVNAAEAIAEVGRPGTVRLACGSEPDGAATFSVSDDGPGIAPENLARLCTPFFTTKGNGTGLGLATVQRIVDAHQGRLDMESRPGSGASFRVTLPAAERIANG